jgi:hypothetical protein
MDIARLKIKCHKKQEHWYFYVHKFFLTFQGFFGFYCVFELRSLPFQGPKSCLLPSAVYVLILLVGGARDPLPLALLLPPL